MDSIFNQSDFLEQRQAICPKCQHVEYYDIYLRCPYGAIINCSKCEFLMIYFWKEKKLFSSFKVEQFDPDKHFILVEGDDEDAEIRSTVESNEDRAIADESSEGSEEVRTFSINDLGIGSKQKKSEPGYLAKIFKGYRD